MIPFPIERPCYSQSEFIYNGTCTFKQFYTGETKRNPEVQLNEHCSIQKTAKDHLLVDFDYNITWKIITKAPAQTFKQKILEAFYIS